jgi:hypothetical protein
VDVGVAALEADVQFTRECADWLGWKFDQQKGSSKLIEDLLGGFWDNERFLVLEPGQTAQMTADGQVVRPIAKDRIEEKAQ